MFRPDGIESHSENFPVRTAPLAGRGKQRHVSSSRVWRGVCSTICGRNVFAGVSRSLSVRRGGVPEPPIRPALGFKEVVVAGPLFKPAPTHFFRPAGASGSRDGCAAADARIRGVPAESGKAVAHEMVAKDDTGPCGGWYLSFPPAGFGLPACFFGGGPSGVVVLCF